MTTLSNKSNKNFSSNNSNILYEYFIGFLDIKKCFTITGIFVAKYFGIPGNTNTFSH